MTVQIRQHGKGDAQDQQRHRDDSAPYQERGNDRHDRMSD